MEEIGYNRNDIKLLYKMKRKSRNNSRYNSGPTESINEWNS